MTTLPETYLPSPEEEYMNSLQVEYFRNQLLNQRYALNNAENKFAKALMEKGLRKPDLIDQGAAAINISVEIETNGHKKQLLREIDYALNRMAEGEYGYCEVTGDEIGLKRLLARPTATMCIEMQERFERSGMNSYSSISMY